MAMKKEHDDVLYDGKSRNVEFDYEGKTIKVEYWPLTWEKKTKIEDEATEYYKDKETGKMMFRRSMGKYQIAMLKAMVHDTNIPSIPGAGWARLPGDLGDAMLEAIMEQETPSEEELEDAKKSSTGEEETTSPQESPKQVASSAS